jgi:hypothetical protein
MTPLSSLRSEPVDPAQAILVRRRPRLGNHRIARHWLLVAPKQNWPEKLFWAANKVISEPPVFLGT